MCVRGFCGAGDLLVNGGEGMSGKYEVEEKRAIRELLRASVNLEILDIPLPPDFVTALNEARKLPDSDSDCEYCMGTGEFYTHSPDCGDDLCALAGGYHDCDGRVVGCGCSITKRKLESEALE